MNNIGFDYFFKTRCHEREGPHLLLIINKSLRIKIKT
jgi:hypothetical protein